jgi:hypothetical protein
MVLAEYPTGPEAQKAFANVQNNLDGYLKVQEKGAGRLVFRDFNNEFGVISVSGKRMSILLHLSKLPSGQGR